MLEQVKNALRIMSDDFDDEITLLIAACIENLQKLGVYVEVDTEGVPESAQIRPQTGRDEDDDRIDYMGKHGGVGNGQEHTDLSGQ